MNTITNTNRGLTVVNVGADLFADAIEAQGIAVTRVAWRPPAGRLRFGCWQPAARA